MIYATTRLFYENNFTKETIWFYIFILCVLHGGFNMNIRCNQKLMFCKDRGIDFSGLIVQAIRPALLGISILPPGIFENSNFNVRHYGDSLHFTARWTEKGSFPTLQPSSKTKLSVRVRQKRCLRRYIII